MCHLTAKPLDIPSNFRNIYFYALFAVVVIMLQLTIYWRYLLHRSWQNAIMDNDRYVVIHNVNIKEKVNVINSLKSQFK